MFYSIRHITKFTYTNPVYESMTEVRMQPRTDERQRNLAFQLSVSPRARVTTYQDHFQNSVHHFDVPGRHTRLMIVAESLVQLEPPRPLPYSLHPTSWDTLDAMVEGEDHWDMLMPSEFACSCGELDELADALNVRRRDDPLRLLRELNTGLFHWFEYVPKSTRVDSPISDALKSRAGVCQDFAHIMLALARSLRIPCRYVSGYLYRSTADHDRSTDGATHAWVEALLPELGWVGFDPTNNLMAESRHIRTAIGRDYADVPPTKGTYKGSAREELSVSVSVFQSDRLPPPVEEMLVQEDWSTYLQPEPDMAQQQQQQQQ